MAEPITLTFAGFTRTRNFPNGSGARALAAARLRLGMPSPTYTATQVFNAVADELFRCIEQNTVNSDREQARITADAGVAPMPMT